MKVVALIPARYGATRFPAKLLADLCGKPLIVRTYESTVATGVFDEVMVVTDHDAIEREIRAIGGKVFRSKKRHESGSDRIAEAISDHDADVVVNVQGDEPFQDKKSLTDLVSVFSEDNVGVASMMAAVTDHNQISNPNTVKVVLDKDDFALYFSRLPIPYLRDEDSKADFYRHIGIYAYRKSILMDFTKWEKSHLEKAEKLEQLRLLENGIRIKMVPTDHQPVAIDTPEDLEKAILYFKMNFG